MNSREIVERGGEGGRARIARFDDLFQFIRYCVTGENHPVRLPEIPMYLDWLVTAEYQHGLTPMVEGRFVGIVAIDDHHVLGIFGHRGFHLPTVADSLGIRLAGAVRGSGKRDHLEPRVILKQRDKTLTDHTGGTKDADLQFFGHDDLYDLWVSMDYLRRTAVMRVAVKQCNCTKHAEQRQWSSQMVAAQ